MSSTSIIFTSPAHKEKTPSFSELQVSFCHSTEQKLFSYDNLSSNSDVQLAHWETFAEKNGSLAISHCYTRSEALNVI